MLCNAIGYATEWGGRYDYLKTERNIKTSKVALSHILFRGNPEKSKELNQTNKLVTDVFEKRLDPNSPKQPPEEHFPADYDEEDSDDQLIQSLFIEPEPDPGKSLFPYLSKPDVALTKLHATYTGANSIPDPKHRDKPYSAEASLAANLKPKLKTRMASHQELLDIFSIPYDIVIVEQGKASKPMSSELASPILKSASLIAVGDMHASFQKLLETLVICDLVTLPFNSAQACATLLEPLNNRKLNLKEQRKIYESLQKVVHSMHWKGDNRTLILLGDVLSDRGPLDMITLDLLLHLKKQASEGLIWNASNHDHNVLTSFSKTQSYILYSQIPSLIRAIKLAKYMGTETQKHFLKQCFSYLSQSRLLYFDQENMTLFSHAPIGNEQLKMLKPFLKPGTPDPDKITTSADIQCYVDAMNRFYRDYVKHQYRMLKKSFWKTEPDQPELYKSKKSRLANRQAQVEPQLTRVNHPTDTAKGSGFLWTRKILQHLKELPFHQAGVKTLVYGHTQEIPGKLSPFSINHPNKREDYTLIPLDQDCRKEDALLAHIAENNLFYIQR